MRQAHRRARRPDAGPLPLGTASRLSPEAAVPVVDFVEQSECLGGRATWPQISLRSGAREIFGFSEMTSPGAPAKMSSRREHRGPRHYRRFETRHHGEKTRIIARHQQVVRVDRERASRSAQKPRKGFCGCFLRAQELDALVLSDYDKGLITDDFADRF